MTTDFKVLLQAVIDTKSIGQANINEIQKTLEKYHLNLTADLNNAALIKSIREVIPQLEAELKKITGVEIKINDADILRAIKQISAENAKAAKEQERAFKAQEKAALKSAEAQEKNAKKIREAVKSKDIAREVSNITAQYDKLSNKSDDLKNDFTELNRLQKALGASTTDEQLITNYGKFNELLAKVKNNLTILNNEQKNTVKTSDKLASSLQITSQIGTMKSWGDSNGKALKKYGAEFNRLLNQLSTVEKMPSNVFEDIKRQFSELKVMARDSGDLGATFGEKLSKAWEKFGGWSIATGTLMRGVQAVKNGITTIRELDTALVDLRKTTSATAQELNKFYYDANVTAKQLGVTTQEIISQTSEWSRLGYALNEAQTLAKNSAILTSISPDLDIQRSTDGLVSTLKAFKLEADDSLDGIISKINIIGNTQAVSNGDIVDILTRSSSAMASANNTLEQTIALGTAATEITRNAAEVGTALKTKNCLYVQKCA